MWGDLVFSAKYKTLGLKISYNRRLKGLKQSDLASMVGISTSYLSEIERGTKLGAPLSIYWRIAEALNVKFEKLLEE